MKTNELIDNISKVIVGKEETIELLLTCMLAGGHVLLEDIPGTGKPSLPDQLQLPARQILSVFSLHQTFFLVMLQVLMYMMPSKMNLY